MDTYDTIKAVRRSDIQEMRKSPAHYKYAVENGREDSTALRLGRLIHTGILEYMDYHDRYKIAPTVDRRTKAGREQYEAFLESLELGQEAITEEENEMVHAMRTALHGDPYASRYLTEFRPEQIFCWTDPETGIACKMKADAVTVIDGSVVIVDYKTTDSCADGHFERSAVKYGYRLQAGMYTEGYFANTYTEPRFVFVAQEKKPPYACRVYECDPYFVKQGKTEFHTLLQILKHCTDTNEWPGYYPTELLGD